MSDIIRMKRVICMKIIVYGMGIIGASFAGALRRAGHTVLGRNRGKEALSYALEHGMIDAVTQDYSGADVVILALPPRVTMRELDEGNFPEGCIVTDVCGVKAVLEDVVCSRPRVYRYVGMHPMAGKETSGVRSASASLFSGANFILTSYAGTDRAALESVRSLAADAGAGRILVCSARQHDRMIALTSQLAHVVANAYVTSPLAAACKGFTGGSFQDMSRVAPVDEAMWAELFCLNSACLVSELDRLIGRLASFRDAISAGEEEAIRALMREGKECYAEFFHGN